MGLHGDARLGSTAILCVCRGFRRRGVLGVDRSEDVGSVHVPGALNSPIPSPGFNGFKPTVDFKLTGGSCVWGRARSGTLDLASTGHRIATPNTFYPVDITTLNI